MVEEKWPAVAEWIALQIRAARWPVGSTLPSYRDLPVEAGVAEGTARKAVAHLAALGYVRVRPHVGVKVLVVPPDPLPPMPATPSLEDRVAALEARLDEHERGHGS